VDSYLNFPTLQALHERGRILSSDNQDGFIPGEAACCLLIGRPNAIKRIPPLYSNVQTPEQPLQPAAENLFCSGLAISREVAVVGGTAPNRAVGLAEAIKTALKAVQDRPDTIGLRISAQSSEDFYAKEFAMACSRAGVSATPLWCLADSLGETGAAAGLLAVGWAYASGHKGYIPASHALCLSASDEGERAAVVLGFGQYKP
jgi:3-oxoacyl-[acyl-carrier-protein] synthase-1